MSQTNPTTDANTIKQPAAYNKTLTHPAAITKIIKHPATITKITKNTDVIVKIIQHKATKNQIKVQQQKIKSGKVTIPPSIKRALPSTVGHSV